MELTWEARDGVVCMWESDVANLEKVGIATGGRCVTSHGA